MGHFGQKALDFGHLAGRLQPPQLSRILPLSRPAQNKRNGCAQRTQNHQRRHDGGQACATVGRLDLLPQPSTALLALDDQFFVQRLADTSFTYSRGWLRGLMAHLTAPRFAPALRSLTPPVNCEAMALTPNSNAESARRKSCPAA